MCIITTFVILAVTNNVVLSIGMIGALSIIRFRTAIKAPLDMMYIFWALSVGVVLGAGLIPLAIVGSLFLGFVFLLFSNTKKMDFPYRLAINCENVESEKLCFEIIHLIVKPLALARGI